MLSMRFPKFYRDKTTTYGQVQLVRWLVRGFSAAIICLFLALVACQQTPPTKSPPVKTDETPPSVEKVLWQLDTTKSQISYISTKNGDIREHNTLRFLTGSIMLIKRCN